METGLTHIYTGDGKGKTTAAYGLALRAAGNRLNVRIFSFCASHTSGENKPILLANFVRVRCSKPFPNIREMRPEEHAAWLEEQLALFDEACEAACDKSIDMVVLDDVLAAMHQGVMDVNTLCYLIEHKNPGTELVLTGRGAPRALIEKADYVTEMRLIKHPYQDSLITARRGIEY